MESSTPLLSSFLHLGHSSLLQHHKVEKCTGGMESSTSNWAPGKLLTTDSCMNVMGCSGEPNFRVDDLLDLSDEEDHLGSPVVSHADAAATSLLFAHQPHSANSTEKFQMNLDEAALHDEPAYGLCVPPDELAHQLEWLSAFNEDNFFTGGDSKLLSSLPSSSRAISGLTRCKEAPIIAHKARDNFHSQSPVSVLEQGSHLHANPCALNHAYKAHRVRKARTGGRVWSLDILKPILLEKRLKASYANTSLLVSPSSSLYSEPVCSFLQQDDSERPYKKMKQDYCAVDSALVRRCTHCLVQKTPQWRAGPLGPKTLCNACGVRYKSGRLVPEYRPAASPSFVNEVHSNSHRRILEMRRAKDVEDLKNKVERVERAYATDSHDTSEENLSKHGCLEMLSSTESSLCEEILLCEKAEVKKDDDTCGEGRSGKEAPIDGGMVSCDSDTTSNEVHLHEARGNTGKDTLVCEEEGMQVNACMCNLEAVCQGKPTCTKDAIANSIEQNNVDPVANDKECKGPLLGANRRQKEEGNDRTAVLLAGLAAGSKFDGR